MGLIAPDYGLLLWMAFTILIVILLPLIALIDLLKNNFVNNDKLIWTIVVIVVLVIGPILYFVIGRKQKIK